MATKKATKHEFDTFSHNADELRTLVDQYNGIQRQRLAAGNRAKAIERGDDFGDSEMYRKVADSMQVLEEDIAKHFKEEVRDHPVGDYLLSIRGIGPTMAAKTIGHIGDIRRFITASKLWRFAGYGLVPRCGECDAWIEEVPDESNGSTAFKQSCSVCGSTEFKMVAERPVRGRRLHYDPKFKTMLHTLAENLLRSDSPYRKVYDDAYDYYLNNRPSWAVCQDCDAPVAECKNSIAHSEQSYRARAGKGWSTKRIHLAARRKMIKIFLSHVFESWRRIEGLVVRRLYVHEVLGHEDRLMPEQFTDYKLPAVKWAKR